MTLTPAHGPKCGGPFTQYARERRCLPCRAAYLRRWRAERMTT